MKVVINKCYGGFSLSDLACSKISEITGKTVGSYEFSSKRTDSILIQVVEEIGCKAASGPYANLTIVEVPDGVDWEIDEYDGQESVREKSRVWF